MSWFWHTSLANLHPRTYCLMPNPSGRRENLNSDLFTIIKFKIQTPPPVPSDDPQDLDLFAYASAISNTGEKNKNKTKLIATWLCVMCKSKFSMPKSKRKSHSLCFHKSPYGLNCIVFFPHSQTINVATVSRHLVINVLIFVTILKD